MSQARPRDEGPPAPEVRRRPRRHSEDREEGGRMARAPRTTHQGRTGNRSARRGSSASAAKAKRLKRIGIVDTSFSRYDMAAAGIDELRKQGGGFTVERYTVPGIKDLAAGARVLFDRGWDLVLALGMGGRQTVGKESGLPAGFGALARADARGVRVTSVVRVPGVFEIPLAVERLLERADVDAAVAIGAVIKGETLHDEALMAAVPKALLDIERATRKPIGLGITGPGMTDDQAMARADKGAEAVDVALAMYELLRGL